jgi:hypothetical protein
MKNVVYVIMLNCGPYQGGKSLYGIFTDRNEASNIAKEKSDHYAQYEVYEVTLDVFDYQVGDDNAIERFYAKERI